MFLKEKTIAIPTVKNIEQTLEYQRELLAVKENATVIEAAEIMTHNQVGALVVLDCEGNFVGVLTERDILAKVTTTHTPPHNLLVSQIMTTEPFSCTLDTPIEVVQQLMAEHKIRHVPIVDDDQPIAMVSSRDIIAYQLHNSKAMKTAAEQLAMLSTELKNLNLKDVIALAVNEVPKSFQAGRAVLCLPRKPAADLVIYRKECPMLRKELLEPEKIRKIHANPLVRFESVCSQCRKLGAEAPRLIIPLAIHEQFDDRPPQDHQTQAFLCMCQIKSVRTHQKELLLYKASLVQEMLSLNLTNAKLYYDYQKARRDSEQDPLTEVGSRRILEQVMHTEYARSIRYKRPFSIAIVDVDKFKQINDSAGHAAGDNTLREIAKIMRTNVRMTDTIIIRYGGDEFVLIMPETRLDEAAILLERLRKEVKNTTIPKVGQITISCGIAEWSGSLHDDPEIILNRADDALYQAKRNGRDRVVTSADTHLPSPLLQK